MCVEAVVQHCETKWLPVLPTFCAACAACAAWNKIATMTYGIFNVVIKCNPHPTVNMAMDEDLQCCSFVRYGFRLRGRVPWTCYVQGVSTFWRSHRQPLLNTGPLDLTLEDDLLDNRIVVLRLEERMEIRLCRANRFSFKALSCRSLEDVIRYFMGMHERVATSQLNWTVGGQPEALFVKNRTTRGRSQAYIEQH